MEIVIPSNKVVNNYSYFNHQIIHSSKIKIHWNKDSTLNPLLPRILPLEMDYCQLMELNKFQFTWNKL